MRHPDALDHVRVWHQVPSDELFEEDPIPTIDPPKPREPTVSADPKPPSSEEDFRNAPTVRPPRSSRSR